MNSRCYWSSVSEAVIILELGFVRYRQQPRSQSLSSSRPRAGSERGETVSPLSLPALGREEERRGTRDEGRGTRDEGRGCEGSCWQRSSGVCSKLIGIVSTDVFEPRTATESRMFYFLAWFCSLPWAGKLLFLCLRFDVTNTMASKRSKDGKIQRPVDFRGSKTSVLKFPNKPAFKSDVLIVSSNLG